MVFYHWHWWHCSNEREAEEAEKKEERKKKEKRKRKSFQTPLNVWTVQDGQSEICKISLVHPVFFPADGDDVQQNLANCSWEEKFLWQSTRWFLFLLETSMTWASLANTAWWWWWSKFWLPPRKSWPSKKGSTCVGSCLVSPRRQQVT